MDADFKFLKLGLPSRLAAMASVYALSIALQVLAPSLGLLWLALAACAWAFAAVKPITNKPDDQGLEQWRPVGMAEVDRLADTLRRSAKLRKDMGKGAFAGLGITAAIGSLFISFVYDRWDLWFWTANAFVFLVPALFFGNAKVFLPKDLAMRMEAFKPLMSAALPRGLVLVPYLRFDKDKAGRDVPEDLRAMLEPRRKPEDLVGMQLQVAINSGPNGEVPYMYAVLLTKGKGASWESAGGLAEQGFVVEPGGDESYGTVVFRQDTGKAQGYYTDKGDVERLIGLCQGVLGKLCTLS